MWVLFVVPLLASLRIPIFPKRNQVYLRQIHAIFFLLTVDLVQTTDLHWVFYMLRCYSENIPGPLDWMLLKRVVRYRHTGAALPPHLHRSSLGGTHL